MPDKIILISIAAILNALMDLIQFRRGNVIFDGILDYDISRFTEWFLGNRVLYRWWLHPIFWDGWHFCKETMLALFFYLIADSFIEFVQISSVWFFWFTLFYQSLLRK